MNDRQNRYISLALPPQSTTPGGANPVFWISCVLLALVPIGPLRAGNSTEAPSDRYGLSQLPLASQRTLPPDADWLIDNSSFQARVCRTDTTDTLTLENGLVRRTFRLAPNAATVGLDNLVSGQSLLRAIRPEAIVTINGKRHMSG